MPISIDCPSCLDTFSMPDTTAGRKFRCPTCQFVLFVPGGEATMDIAPAPRGDILPRGTAPNVEPIKVKLAAPNAGKNPVVTPQDFRRCVSKPPTQPKPQPEAIWSHHQEPARPQEPKSRESNSP